MQETLDKMRERIEVNSAYNNDLDAELPIQRRYENTFIDDRRDLTRGNSTSSSSPGVTVSLCLTLCLCVWCVCRRMEEFNLGVMQTQATAEPIS